MELIGLKEHIFFIVQVKSTTQGVDKKNNLKIQAPVTKLRGLNRYYCPTYLAGVNVKTDDVFLIPINTSKRKNIGKLPTGFILNTANRRLLFDDVKDFWDNSGLKSYKQTFKHNI